MLGGTFNLLFFKNKKIGDFPGGPVVKLHVSNQGVHVRSLVKELRSYIPSSVAKTQTKKIQKAPTKTSSRMLPHHLSTHL